MSIIPKHVGLSIQRSVKVGEYQYNKVNLEMVVNVEDEQPTSVINKLYNYIDVQVDRLLKIELAKVDSNKQAIVEKMEEDDGLPFCPKTE